MKSLQSRIYAYPFSVFFSSTLSKIPKAPLMISDISKLPKSGSDGTLMFSLERIPVRPAMVLGAEKAKDF